MVVKKMFIGMRFCILALAAFGVGCGAEESSGGGGGRNCEMAAPSLQATRAQEFLGELLLWAPTNGLNHLSVSFPIATGRLERVRRKLLELEEVLLSVSDKVERIVFLRDSANRILGGVVARTNDWEELDYYLSSRIMLDTTASAMWKTSEDGDWIVSLWTRQRWKCMEAERRCREELLVLKEEHRRLTTESYKQALKSVTLRLADLTEADRVIRQELRERKPQIEKRLLVLGWLLDLYPCWDVGELGRKLDGGRLYERFKSLTPEQFREIEDRVKARDGK